jgi:type VI secretion system secreted protein VgrG
MSQKIINVKIVGNKKGSGTILILALLLLAIFTIAANYVTVNDVSAATQPSLGTASTFAVLAATEVTDVPTSAIRGDVGLSPAAGTYYSGLTCGEVAGTIYQTSAGGPAPCAVTNPGLLTTAKADESNAYTNGLGSQACDTTYAGTKDLAGSNLGPGVYCAGAFRLSGTLTLSGPGVWIFKSATDLITSGTANVVGGDACTASVWWWVASSATLGTSTQLTGNILALTSITLNTGATLNGRALAQTGAVTLDDDNVNLTCALVSPITTSITTTLVGGIVTTIASTSFSITTFPTGTIIPEYPWGVLLLLILMLPAYMLLKRRTRSH